MIFYIPAYWHYSFSYSDDTTLCNFKYRTFVNNITILPDLFLHFLQKTNIKYTTTKNVKNIDVSSESQSKENVNSSGSSNNTPNDDSSQETINSFGQPKSIEEMTIDRQRNNGFDKVEISKTHDKLIRPALESPNPIQNKNDTTSISDLTTSI